MWKWQSGECKVLQGHKEQVRCFSPLSNSPDNTRLLSWSFDGTVKVKQTHTYTDTLVSAALNQIQNKISLFLSFATRCGTWKAERSFRTSRLIGGPSCLVMPRQTDATSPPPLLTRPLRFNTYTHTWDETYLFAPSVTTRPITHQRLPLRPRRNSLLCSTDARMCGRS